MTYYIDTEKLFDIPAREVLLDRAFGPTRRQKTSERLREGRLPAEGLSFVARAGDRVVATLRLWHVEAGGVPALLLGPLAVDPLFQGGGLGSMLMREAIARARGIGHGAIILVGDVAYYDRFGFARAAAERLDLPGAVDPARFLGLELAPGALRHAAGMVRATGAVPLFGPEGMVSRRRAA